MPFAQLAPIAGLLLLVAGTTLAVAGFAGMWRRRPFGITETMLRPIRAWRVLIFGLAVAIVGLGFAIDQPWVTWFGIVLGIVEGIESSLMVAALEDEAPLQRGPRARSPH